MFSVPGTAKKIVPKYRKLHTTYLISEDSEEEYYDDYAEEEGTKNYKVWVATLFWVARTHLARPDLGAHAHVCAPPIWSGRTSHPHF